ncbi:MAG: hypothetical protein IPK82_43510 [Polyangiaceae bacterium]|nr:hypothetical protein [Polyangiaceae bacterium]
MNEQNRLRIERLAARYEERMRVKAPPDEEEFLASFTNIRKTILRPALQEVANELKRAGHLPTLVESADLPNPFIELTLGLTKAPAARNAVGFAVIRWVGYPLQILAYLEVNPPRFDLTRFARPEDIRPDQVEQLLVDAVEHIVMCNAP